MSSSEWKKQKIADCETQGGEDSVYLMDDTVSAKSPESGGVCRSLLRSTACFLGAVLLSFLVVLMYFQISHRRTFSDEDIRKSWMQFRGIDDVSFEQEVTRPTSGDYVMYHVTQPGGEAAWIVDHYSQGYRLMKMSSAYEQVCYLATLNTTRGEPDVAGFTDLQTGETGNRKKRQTTFFVDETREVDLSQLGHTAVQLCLDIQSYWIHPTTQFSRNHDEFSRTHGRDKRNVKKCVVSCCSMVCCCNQKWLQWQSTSMFNCHNVCHGCTSKSKMDVTDVC